MAKGNEGDVYSTGCNNKVYNDVSKDRQINNVNCCNGSGHKKRQFNQFMK